MGANMHSQSTPLDEALAAPRRVARIGSLVGVYPVVSLQVGLAVEALNLRLVIVVRQKWRGLFGDRLGNNGMNGWGRGWASHPGYGELPGRRRQKGKDNEPYCIAASRTGRGEP